MRDMTTSKRLGLRVGFTLMELLLTIALLGVIAAASIGVLYWQVRVQARVTESAVHMNKLLNTQILARKILRRCVPASLTVDVSGTTIRYVPPPPVTTPFNLFEYEDNVLKYKGEVILENVIATFTNLEANGTKRAVAPLDELAQGGMVQVELLSLGRERRSMRFVVRPRGVE